MPAKYVFVAGDLGIFEKLADGPATLEELAAMLGTPRRTTRIIARRPFCRLIPAMRDGTTHPGGDEQALPANGPVGTVQRPACDALSGRESCARAVAR